MKKRILTAFNMINDKNFYGMTGDSRDISKHEKGSLQDHSQPQPQWRESQKSSTETRTRLGCPLSL